MARERLRVPGPSAWALERVVLKEGLEVAARGCDLALGQLDDQRFGELEEAAAFSPAMDRQLRAGAGGLQRLVDLEIERAPGRRRGELLVLRETGAGDRRLVPPPHERAHIDHRRAHPERPLTGPPDLQQSRIPQRGLGDVLHDGKDLVRPGARSPSRPRTRSSVSPSLLCACFGSHFHPATARAGSARVLARAAPGVLTPTT